MATVRRSASYVVVWPSLKMGKSSSITFKNSVSHQIGLALNYSAILRIQSDTVSSKATQLCDSNEPTVYGRRSSWLFWCMSRAKNCAVVIFVGDRIDTCTAVQRVLAAVHRVLAKSSKSDLDVIQQYLMTRPSVRQICLETHPFLSVYRELCCHVYVIAGILHSCECYLDLD